MTIGLSFQFLAGRYHATPWNRQVNEGVVEWPPSPWRILRALVSAYYRLPQRPDRSHLLGLVTQLAEVEPYYHLPPYTPSHTRHYMPIRREGQNKTTRVLDTFYAIAREENLQVWWPGVTLSAEEQGVLGQLCEAIAYLGRAESWVSVTVGAADYPEPNAVPLTDAQAQTWERDATETPVLLPLTTAGLLGFQAALATLPKPKKGKKAWQAPADLLMALEVDIGDLHRQGWHGVPGSHWVSYRLRPPTAPARSQQRSALALLTQQEAIRPNFARFRLVAPVLPPLTQAVSLGDRLHRALIKLSTTEQARSVFSGRDDENNPCQGHQHAFFLPEDLDQDGKIDHLVIWVRDGFSDAVLETLAKLHKIRESGQAGLQLVLISMGRATPEQGGILGRGRVWQSVTPLVLPWHPKKQGKYSVEGQIQQQLRAVLNLETEVEVEVWEQGRFFLPTGQSRERRHFYGSRFWLRRRNGHGHRGVESGLGFTLTFTAAVDGPIALGADNHFGLGLFIPVE